jgi:FkbM family methyltransferase
LSVRGVVKRLIGEAPQRIEVRDDGRSYVFVCGNAVEEWRARTLLEKEAGTVAWIKQHVKSGQVFLDVGANIGLYTILAGKHVGAAGLVYAFEPHLGNALRLMKNVRENGLDAQVKVLSVALNDTNGYIDFNYHEELPGSSMSQLGSQRDSEEREFDAVLRELKCAVTVDTLIAGGHMRPPHHIKIDVDGNELLVLKGMGELLRGSCRPLSVQVEINRRYKEEVIALMRDAGYGDGIRHDTQAGLKKIAAGGDPEAIAHNVVFYAARA